VLAWPAWRATGGADSNAAAPDGRTRFLALTGLGSGALFVLVAMAGIVPLVMLAPCE